MPLDLARKAPGFVRKLGPHWRKITTMPDQPHVWPDWISGSMMDYARRCSLIMIVEPAWPSPIIALTPQGRVVRDYIKARRLTGYANRSKSGGPRRQSDGG